ncbi:MAG: DUF3365 domain-containing protein [Verrucomicrobia bacterium]|nr:DUF3365 domain-containing protein [Cytophagales bacterium]
MKEILFFIFSGFLLVACGNPERVDDSKAVKEGIEDRKVRRITQTQIMEATTNWGKSSVPMLEKSLSEILTKQIKANGIAKAADFCKVSKIPAADSLKSLYEASVKRLTLSNLPTPRLHPKENELLSAYRYNSEKKLPIETNIQKSDTFMFYTTAVVLKEKMCLQCHGKVGTDILEKDFQAIKQKYPNLDSLTNYTLNQPIGIWSIVFDKKNLVRKIGKKK